MGENNSILTNTGYLVAPPLKVDIAEGQIWLDDEPKHVGQMAFRLLCALMERPEKLWTKDELIEVVWEGRSVTDAVLTTAMRELRKALAEPARNPKFIETVHGRGYRFLLQVKAIPAAGTASLAAVNEPAEKQTETSASAAAKKSPPYAQFALGGIALLAAVIVFVNLGRLQSVLSSVEADDSAASQIKPSIAVLPFDDYSPDQSQQWFADGLVEEILNSLSRSPKIRVAGRRSTFGLASEGRSVQEVAAELGVEHILEGSVRVDGDQMRITIQLVRAKDDMHLWSQTYDRDRSEIIKVQQDIATQVAKALGLAMNPVELNRMINTGTTSVEAYEHYLEGLALIDEFTRTGRVEFQKLANEAFEKARMEDPQFANAHLGAALYWRTQFAISYISDGAEQHKASLVTENYRTRMKAAIDNEGDEIARYKLEAMLASVDMEYRKQMRMLESYLEIYPDEFRLWALYAEAAMSLGEVASARKGAAQLQRIIRENGQPWARGVTISVHVGDHEEAVEIAKVILERHPEEIFAVYQAHRAFLAAGRVEEAKQLMPKIEAGGLPDGSIRLAQLRQTCAENNVSTASALATSIIDRNPDEIVTRWLALKIVGRDDEAHELLRPLDRAETMPQLASLLPYSFFDPREFENLHRILVREGALERRIDRPAYFCDEAV